MKKFPPFLYVFTRCITIYFTEVQNFKDEMLKNSKKMILDQNMPFGCCFSRIYYDKCQFIHQFCDSQNFWLTRKYFLPFGLDQLGSFITFGLNKVEFYLIFIQDLDHRKICKDHGNNCSKLVCVKTKEKKIEICIFKTETKISIMISFCWKWKRTRDQGMLVLL